MNITRYDETDDEFRSRLKRAKEQKMLTPQSMPFKYKVRMLALYGVPTWKAVYLICLQKIGIHKPIKNAITAPIYYK